MNFKGILILFFVTLMARIAPGQSQPPSTMNVGGIVFSRPLILRSDFVAKDVLRMFMVRSKFSGPEQMARYIGFHPGIGCDWFSLDYVKDCRRFVKGDLHVAPTPKLKGGNTLAVADGFDRFGGSRFPNGTVIMTKKGSSCISVGLA